MLVIDGLKLKVLFFCIDESWQLEIEFFWLFNLKTIYIECFFKAFFAVPCPTFASHSEDIVAETRVERKRRGVSSGIKWGVTCCVVRGLQWRAQGAAGEGEVVISCSARVPAHKPDQPVQVHSGSRPATRVTTSAVPPPPPAWRNSQKLPVTIHSGRRTHLQSWRLVVTDRQIFREISRQTDWQSDREAPSRSGLHLVQEIFTVSSFQVSGQRGPSPYYKWW